MNVNGKVSVVTGGASGIGLALCNRFAKEGVQVVLSDVDQEACNRRAEPIGAPQVAADVGREEDVMHLLGVIRETKLGDYQDDFKQTPVTDRLCGFQQDLSAAEDEIIGRNRLRPHTYDYLRPSLVPNSINI